MSLNKCLIIGRLGADPDYKVISDTAQVCNLSVATSEKWKDKSGEMQERTEWHRVSVWGKAAENCAKYLKKGSQVYVEGSLRTEKYEKDGQEKYATKLIASQVQFLSTAKGDDQTQSEPEAPSASDDLGFN